MATDTPPAITTTETDFARSVDREIIRQVGGMNLRGLRALREALSTSRPGLPVAAESLREQWLALDDGAVAAVADAPYLLFDLSLEPAFEARRHRLPEEAPPPPAETGLCGAASGRGFARLMCHFAWQTSKARPAAAALLLGVNASTCNTLRALDLLELDAIAETAGECVSLRWGADLRFWSRRLDAARTADRAALWESTLAGVQRLAALARA
ncbi:MAG: hypothetical protein RL580_955 [Pseudomonadota bacterium]|jgi:hypothetical protein